MKNKDLLAYLSALGAAFFWSFSFIWFKIAYLGYNPITVVIFRLTLSALIITIIGLFLKRLQKPTGNDIWLFLLMALFEPFIYFLGESYGLLYVSSTVAAVIVATIPLISPLFAWYFFREKLKWMNVAGLTLSFFGVALVVLNSSFQFDASPLGVGLEFIAVLSAIGYSLVLRKIVTKYNTISIVAYQNIIGIFYFLPVWLFVDFNDFLQRPFHSEAFRAIVLLAVFSSLLAFVFFTQSIRQIGVNRSNSFINLIPVFVAILSFFVLNESLNLQKFTGIVIVVAGLFLAQIKRKAGNRQIAEIEHTL